MKTNPDMRTDNPSESFLRLARFETFEERLVLSAQPVAELIVDPAEAAQAQPQYGEVAPALANSNEASGVNYAHENYGFTGKGQTVAVIDTGIAYDHLSLGGGFGEGHRVVGGWDFAENDADPYDDGPFGFHGTHVAGIVGSDHDVHTGVAPDADLVALRVFDDNGFSDMKWIEQALDWVHNHRDEFNITTVNLSLGTSWNADDVPSWATLEDEFLQLKNDGIFISVAAGNSFHDFNTTGLSYPAASHHVVPVASHGADGTMSNFSQRNDRVIVAPGEQILSTIPAHLFGGSGASNYFMRASGTSMAAPYLAGASAVLREAMDFAGYENITQDTLYYHFRSTADMIYDSVTNMNFHQLNLQSALDSLLADEYGSDAGSAHQLGMLAGNESFSGMISNLSDVDYFTFTAGQSGTINLTADTTHEMAASWQLIGGGASIDGNAISFDVVAGQSYTVALGSSDGLGNYEVSVQLEATESNGNTTDWGTVAARTIEGEAIAGESWHQLTASRDGILTIEAIFSHAGGNVDLQLHDANDHLIAGAYSTTNGERMHVKVEQGQTYYLRAIGENSDVDFRLTNLVERVGNQLHVYGTDGNDSLSLAAGSVNTMVVNGVQYRFSNVTKSVAFHGAGGSDSVTIVGTNANESATMRVGRVQFNGRSITVSADSVENITVDGRGGTDRVVMHDSAGNDVFATSPDSATLSGTGFSNVAENFERVYAYATSGEDRAEMFDSSGSDSFYGLQTHSAMRGDGFYHYVKGFDQVNAHATADGARDRAWLYDSVGDDILVSTPDQTTLSGSGFANQVHGFDRVFVYATAGGNDTAQMINPANDTFISSSSHSVMRGDDYYNYVRGFDSVVESSSVSIESQSNPSHAALFSEMGEDETNGDMPYFSARDTNQDDVRVLDHLFTQVGIQD